MPRKSLKKPEKSRKVPTRAGKESRPAKPSGSPSAGKKAKRGRGPQKAPTKQAVSLRLSPEVLAFFRAKGKGWQTRIDETLKAIVLATK